MNIPEVLKDLESKFEEYCKRNNLHPSPRVRGWWLYEIEDILNSIDDTK